MPGMFCAPIAQRADGRVPMRLIATAALGAFADTQHEDQLLSLDDSAYILCLTDPGLTGVPQDVSALKFYAVPTVPWLFAKTGTRDRVHNGIPYTSDGAVCVEAAASSYWHNGLPFTANGKIAIVAPGAQDE